MNHDEILYGYLNISEFLGVSRDFVGRLVKRDGLPLCTWGHHKLTTRTAIVNWLTRKAEENGAKTKS
jgi:hypothetical protein